ncbi:carboxypeptidase-like regulatory domain-containing protein [Gilvibacter sediminis]|uniref:carboxypeptidase-like regulatory domain-containing protein n=1 Tax=Gilvibacter sediminis TaxID=379071 RepID=UPI00234FDA72|nr:carboxypeptidase-like regulatory domain-containing protein [Gilvibacter sediminis]MDC7996925.1 carboxypeptidase-like regulatory domain-containing protein [Gilvibacter sediminis]
MLSNQRIWILGLLCLVGFNALAQRLEGRVTDEQGRSLEGITVLNLTRVKGTVTNERGNYSIGYDDGDTILFAGLSFSNFEFVAKDLPEDLGPINITMTPETTELDEVVVRSDQLSDEQIAEIIEQNFGAIMPTKVLSNAEKKLYTASSSAGGLVPFDLILNTINGRIRKLKMLNSWEKQDVIIDELQAAIPEEFLREELGLEEVEVYPFLLYCVETSVKVPTPEEMNLSLIEFLLAKWKQYQEQRD